MKHKIHTIWTSDQMRRIQTKNMRIIHDDKKKHINFDKRISWRSFFTVCSDWMNKKKESTIASQYMIHKNKKSMKHCWLWITYKHEHELDFDHSQNHIRNHNMKYEISETSDVTKSTIMRLCSLAAWRSQWNSQLILDHSQK